MECGGLDIFFMQFIMLPLPPHQSLFVFDLTSAFHKSRGLSPQLKLPTRQLCKARHVVSASVYLFHRLRHIQTRYSIFSSSTTKVGYQLMKDDNRMFLSQYLRKRKRRKSKTEEKKQQIIGNNKCKLTIAFPANCLLARGVAKKIYNSLV